MAISNIQVSIIMPAYNSSRFMNQAIESVISQTFTNWELVLVNDFSQDDTADIARAYAEKDKRINYIQHERNQGVAAARNHALEMAKGEYVAFLDSDDYWESIKLEKQLALMKEKKALVCYSYYQRIDEKGKNLALVRPPSSAVYRDLLKSNLIGNLTGIYNARVLGKVFFKTIKHEDYVAWLEILKLGHTAYCVPEVLAYYRVYANSISSNKFKTIGWQWKIYREQEQLNIIESLYFLTCYAFFALYKRV